VTSVGENKEKANTIQPPILVFFLTFNPTGSFREREKKDTKQLYRFLPQSGNSPVPLALPRRVH